MKHEVWMPGLLLAHMATPFLAGLVVLTMTRHCEGRPTEMSHVWFDFFLGIASVVMTTGAFYFAYTNVGG
jgi:hypothetical protein